MKAIDTLVFEHDNIQRMLKVVRQASLQILAGQEPCVADFRKVVEFIRLYADQTHHGKEEQFLFKEMLAELGEMGKNLVQHGMLVEHDLARLHVSNLENALNAYEAGSRDEAKLDILVSAGAYCELLQRHITKENGVVFGFGERQLSPEAMARVEADMAQFEADTANSAVREAQLAVLDELEKKYC